MKLDCVLTAVNNNKLYLDCIPFFIKSWKKLYPNVDIKIILINEVIPDEYLEYKDFFIIFKPIHRVLTSFTSQYIRLLYPSILNYQNGVLTTDIDMIPLNKIYFTKYIEPYSNDKFIYYRGNTCFHFKQIAICYNVATPEIWRNVFNINCINDINIRLKTVFTNNKIKKGHGKMGWDTDQQHLYKHISEWNKNTNNFIGLNENTTKFLRLSKKKLKFNNQNSCSKILIKQISMGKYVDYHLPKPINKYYVKNNYVLKLIQAQENNHPNNSDKPIEKCDKDDV